MRRQFNPKDGNNADLVYARETRRAFEKLKRTQEFMTWKRRQFNIQKSKCAWCRKPMQKNYINVHVDHALALFQGGTNKYSNLVLSHGGCNVRKWIKIDGVPEWIIQATQRYEDNVRLHPLRYKQQKLKEQLIEAELDEIGLEQLKWLIP